MHQQHVNCLINTWGFAGKSMAVNSVRHGFLFNLITSLSHDAASASDIMPCNKIDKPLVVYRFSGNAKTSNITLRKRANLDVFTPKCNF